jgi:6-pyruvoyltetrahydropterin/6-carboxytetrahydropterin synthase
MEENMIKITKHFDCAAAHFLPDYDGPCNRLHGHTYELDISVARTDTDVGTTGMVMDFGELKTMVQENIIKRLDHNTINNVISNPTAENMVKWMLVNLQEALVGPFEVVGIKLWETPTSWCEWSK